MKQLTFALMLLIIVFVPAARGLEEDEIPQYVRVMPVFFVPDDQLPPTQRHLDMVTEHLAVAQQRYKTMLKGRDTFQIADPVPRILRDSFTLKQMQKLESRKFTKYLLNRLFKHFEVNRFNCPYVFLVIVMCPEKPWPRSGARPINPGFNSGAGIAIFSSNKLDAAPLRIQGGFQHELGHAFGLVHVDCYGYDQYTNKSIMSYNKENCWTGLTPPEEPGILIPEDIRDLAMNKRVFPNLVFDAAGDIPEGYKIGRLIRLTFESDIFLQEPYEIKATSACGQVKDTDPGNIVIGNILPNRKAKTGIGLNPRGMWMSGKSAQGRVDLELEFPIAVRLNRIRICSQCGGGLYPIKAVQLEADMDGFQEIALIENITSDEADVCFEERKSKKWRLYMKPDESGQVVLRGLRFFSSHGEIFCPKFPTYLVDCKTWPILFEDN